MHTHDEARETSGCEVKAMRTRGGSDKAVRSSDALIRKCQIKMTMHQYIPLKTGFVRHMLAPYSSYSAFVWHACIWWRLKFEQEKVILRKW